MNVSMRNFFPSTIRAPESVVDDINLPEGQNFKDVLCGADDLTKEYTWVTVGGVRRVQTILFTRSRI